MIQIAANDWVRGGHVVPVWDMLPLVTREHLTEEEHSHIISKMVSFLTSDGSNSLQTAGNLNIDLSQVAGTIGTRENIIDCLDRNDYNHVTATYFLLAERKLRAQVYSLDVCIYMSAQVYSSDEFVSISFFVLQRHDMARRVNKTQGRTPGSKQEKKAGGIFCNMLVE